MDQEAASYFTTDSTFSVPIILSTESLDTFASTAIATAEATTEDSNETAQIQLQSNISQDDASSQSENPDTLLTDTELSLVDPSLEDNETIFPIKSYDASESDCNQAQNLKVCLSVVK